MPEEGALKPGTLYEGTFRLGDFIEVDKKLKEIMVGIFHNAYDASCTCGAEGDLVVGANVAGFLKVADAIVSHGVI